MGSQESTSKGGDHFEGGLLSKFQTETSIDKGSCNKEQIFEPGETTVLIKAVYQMIVKRAITPVQKVTSLGFYSRLFLVPKPGKRWRPVIDLIPTFKMETAENIRDSLQEGESHL